jgi:SdrD B-like domain/Domain of unknown function DUF11
MTINNKQIQFFIQALTLSLVMLLIIFHTNDNMILSKAAFRDFGLKFQTTTTGKIVMIGNTLMSCKVLAIGDLCDLARRRVNTGSNANNNAFDMQPIDMDSDPITTNSSTASLNIGTTGTVLWAGLYVGGNSNLPSKKDLKFDTPSSPGYLNLTSTQDDFNSNTGNDREYQEFVDVTTQVKADPNGLYTVSAGNLTTGTNKYGGWSLVVVYSDPTEPMRNLNVFDGFRNVPVNINLSGFRAPASGLVKADVGMVAWEGDIGVVGDRAKLNNIDLANTLSTANNFFNSTITNNGNQVTNTIPNLVNTMGLDIDTLNTYGYIAPGSTSTTMNLTSSGDGYLSGVVTFGIEVQAPKVQVTKSMTDLNGGDIRMGDILEVSLDINSNGLDTASSVKLTDTIESDLEYIPNSIEYLNSTLNGPKTDLTDADQACYNNSTTTLIFGLGVGASNCNGGEMIIGATTKIKFKVKVKSNLTNGQLVTNNSTVTFKSVILNDNYTATSNEVSLPVVVPPTRLSGVVYNDLNNNAIQDSAELGATPVTIKLIDPITNIVKYTLTTGANGLWSQDVVSGSYKVEVVPPVGKIVTGSTNMDIYIVPEFGSINAGADGINDVTDYSINKLSCGNVISGTNCNYVLSISNLGQGIMRKKIIVTDTLPNSLVYQNYTQGPNSLGWICNLNINIVTCELDQDLNPGEVKSVIITTKVK